MMVQKKDLDFILQCGKNRWRQGGHLMVKNKIIRPLWELNHIFMKMMKKNYSIDHQHCHVISYQEQFCAPFLKAMKTSDQLVQVFIIISPFEASYVKETSQQ